MRSLIYAISILLAAAVCGATAQDAMSGTLYLTPGYSLTKTSGASVAAITVGRVLGVTNVYGTNANQMNTWAAESFTLTNGASREFALSALTNAFGPVAFWRVNFLVVKAGASNANAIVVGGAAADALPVFSSTDDTVSVVAGGAVMVYKPDAAGIVSTGKVMKIANGGTNTVTGELYIGGAK